MSDRNDPDSWALDYASATEMLSCNAHRPSGQMLDAYEDIGYMLESPRLVSGYREPIETLIQSQYVCARCGAVRESHSQRATDTCADCAAVERDIRGLVPKYVEQCQCDSALRVTCTPCRRALRPRVRVRPNPPGRFTERGFQPQPRKKAA